MSKETDKEDSEIERMKKKNPELEELAFKNYHWELLKLWLKGMAVIVGSTVIGLFLARLVPPSFVTPYEPSKIEEISKIILAPSITINGLFITIVPIISFFLIQEIKEQQKSILEQWTEEEKKFEKEDLEVINTYYGLRHILGHNKRSGILRYARTQLTISIYSLLLLLAGFVILNPAHFILFDIILLFSILSGIFPIISIALYKPALRLTTYVVPEKIVKRIEREE